MQSSATWRGNVGRVRIQLLKTKYWRVLLLRGSFECPSIARCPLLLLLLRDSSQNVFHTSGSKLSTSIVSQELQLHFIHTVHRGMMGKPCKPSTEHFRNNFSYIHFGGYLTKIHVNKLIGKKNLLCCCSFLINFLINNMFSFDITMVLNFITLILLS